MFEVWGIGLDSKWLFVHHHEQEKKTQNLEGLADE